MTATQNNTTQGANTMKNLPSFESYSENTPNWNCLRMDVGDLTVWFSYKTPVAFRKLGSPRVVRVNDWSSTTGKHLNWIDGGDKASRVKGDEFERLLSEALA